MDTKLLVEIKQVLNQFPEYWEGEMLLKHKLIDDLRGYKKDLLEKLLSNELIKNTYSIKLETGIVFKVDEFISMLRYKTYWENSYTRYSNEIGLTSEGKYLKYNTDVVLDFPHKDCVLEGGMTKEDLRKKEIYYHKVLAKEEIDTLLSPKVLINIRKYDENGEHEVTEFKDTDNLIIKGNNLIALHSLKEKYAGKVKQIFIDPPYYFPEKRNDSFGYNSNFKLSTWLTFLKNRLEIAKELLSDKGSIWITIDDGGSHYLKILCDDIFGQSNFISNVIWKKKYSPQNDARYFSDMHDHILIFAKNKENFKVNLLPRSKEMNNRYINPDNDPRGPWKPGDFSVKTYSAEYDYSITLPSGRIINPPKGRCWRTSKENFEKLVQDNRIWFGSDGNNVPSIKRFLTEVKQGMTPSTIWDYTEVSHNQEARKEILALDIDIFSTPKPEKLLQRILHIGSNKHDIVLDFFMGSATTQAVAMKMNRRFIGIEQMDYIETVSVPRLRKVIEGEQGGISKDVGWTGGGSFVYAELYPLNQKYVDQIHKANSDKEIEKIIDEISGSAFLDFKVNMEKVTTQNPNFASLTLNEKKDILIQVLDTNQLYLSYSEIDDSQYEIPDSVKQFNQSFYQKSVNTHE